MSNISPITNSTEQTPKRCVSWGEEKLVRVYEKGSETDNMIRRYSADLDTRLKGLTEEQEIEMVSLSRRAERRANREKGRAEEQEMIASIQALLKETEHPFQGYKDLKEKINQLNETRLLDADAAKFAELAKIIKGNLDGYNYLLENSVNFRPYSFLSQLYIDECWTLLEIMLSSKFKEFAETTKEAPQDIIGALNHIDSETSGLLNNITYRHPRLIHETLNLIPYTAVSLCKNLFEHDEFGPQLVEKYGKVLTISVKLEDGKRYPMFMHPKIQTPGYTLKQKSGKALNSSFATAYQKEREAKINPVEKKPYIPKFGMTVYPLSRGKMYFT